VQPGTDDGRDGVGGGGGGVTYLWWKRLCFFSF